MNKTKNVVKALNELAGSSLSLDKRINEGLRIGCESLDMSYAFINRITDGRQYTEYAHGDHELLQPGADADLSESYCQYAIEQAEPYVVEDARSEGLKGEPAYERYELSCYIGGKVMIDGQLYGTVCFADDTPRREITDAQRTNVTLVINWVMGLLRSKVDQKKLQEKSNFLASVTDQFPGAVFEFTIDEGEGMDFTYMSEGLEELAGVTSEQAVENFDSAWESVHPDDREQLRQNIEQVVANQEAFYAEYRYKNGDDVTWVMARSRPTETKSGRTVWRGVFTDITDLKEAQQQLVEANDRKDMLMHEVHHRVKNNLQVVASLLRMQRRKADSETIREALQESSNRVETMSAIHKHLYQINSEKRRVELRSFMKRLFAKLKDLYGECALNVKYTGDVEHYCPDVLIPTALALNELVTNACEYTPAGEECSSVAIEQRNPLVVTVKDNGPGVTREQLNEQSGLGWKLITRLIEKQLGGEVDVKKDEGATIRLTVPTQQAD